jgi:hypothetical protein
VTQFTPELTDDPHPRLRYQTVAYKDARAFSLILERQRGVSARYRARALDVLASEGTNVPNILSTAVVAVIGTDDQDAHLVIANRKARSGGFDANSWAVSIGEQFMPVTGLRGDREVTADDSVISSALRGTREELLGDEYNGHIKVTLQAFCLEDHITADFRSIN